jgi:hypothetical protein
VIVAKHLLELEMGPITSSWELGDGAWRNRYAVKPNAKSCSTVLR